MTIYIRGPKGAKGYRLWHLQKCQSNYGPDYWHWSVCIHGLVYLSVCA